MRPGSIWRAFVNVCYRVARLRLSVMLKLAADENFNNDVVRGLLRRRPDLDIVRIQDTEIMGFGRCVCFAMDGAKTIVSCSWLNAALKVNGKGRCAICP